MEELEVMLASIRKELRETADTLIMLHTDMAKTYEMMNAELDELIKKMREQYE